MTGEFWRRRRLACRATVLWLASALAAMGQSSLRFERVDERAGLSQSSATCILQDRHGFLWFGTRDGLNKYDGYRAIVYRHRPGDPTSLSDNYIYTIYEDRRGDIWAGTYANGLNRLDHETGAVERFVHDPDDAGSLGDNGVMCVAEDKDGALWVGTRYGGLNRFDRENRTFVAYKHDPGDSQSLSHNRVRALLVDRSGALWVGTWGGGLNRMDPESGSFDKYRHDPENPNSLASDNVMGLVEDDQGALWIATWGGGLDRLDPGRRTFAHFRHDPDDPGSLASDSVYFILRDRQGAFWLGYYENGLSRFEPDSLRFDHFPAAEDGTGPSHSWIRAAYEDHAGILWVGSDSGLSKVDPRKSRFAHIKREPGNRGLSNNLVHAILQDSLGRLWVGTDGGLNLVDRQTDSAVYYRHDPDDPQSLSSDLVLNVVEGQSGVLWVGTDGSGLNRFDPREGSFRRYDESFFGIDNPGADVSKPLFRDRNGVIWIGTDGSGLIAFDVRAETSSVYRHDPEDPESLSHDLVLSGVQDSRGDIWIGGMSGLNRLIPGSQKFQRFAKDPDDPTSISHNKVLCFLEDRADRFWIGGGGGLNRFDRDTGMAVYYGPKQGLPSQTIYGVLEDDRGVLWMSGNRGIVKFDPDSGLVRGYDAQDGLQGNEFNRFAYCRGGDGELFFGGDRGVTAFFPDAIRDDPIPPPVAITDFLLFNQSVALKKDDPDSPLEKLIAATDELVLSYRDQVFAFEFAGLHFASPEKNRYAYKLEGFDKEWIETGADRRFAVYTRLDSGSYVFRVKAANQDGVWNETGASLKVRVTPPLWATWPAYGLYSLALAAIVMIFIRVQKRKLAAERLTNRRLRQADKVKGQILANTSHELRTPLNGIIGLAESLLEDGEGLRDSARLREDLSMIAQSGRSLSRLVNDLLDFSRMGKGDLALARQPVDVRQKTDQVFALVKPLIRGRQLTLINDTPADAPLAWADPDRLAQMLHNLVDNAAKFTEKGFVRVAAEPRGEFLSITVADSGQGIPADQLASVFEPFRQLDGSTARLHGGAGLGLSIVRRLARRHGGEITAASEPGAGSVFTLTLPAAQTHERVVAAATESDPAPLAGVAGQTQDCHILIVDDDRVNRRVLRHMLRAGGRRLSEAADGPDALRQLADSPDIDLVLLDIMMPRMSGYEVCRKARLKRGPDELPVIFLTAKNQPADQAKAFEAGANDYLTKPVDKDMLLSRIKVHLDLSRRRAAPAGTSSAKDGETG